MRLCVRLDRARAAIELRHAPPDAKKRIKQTLRHLIVDPLGRRPDVDVRRLRSDRALDRAFYRALVGSWRIVYTFDAETLYIMRVIHRSEGYGWLDDVSL